MIRACEEQSIGLRKTPFDVISRTVRPSERQQNALDTIRSAVSDAADMLAATCPKDVAAMPSKRLDALRHAIEALLESRTTMHPALANFYVSLDDEQKAKIVVNLSSNVQTKPNRDSRLAANFDNQENADQTPFAVSGRRSSEAGPSGKSKPGPNSRTSNTRPCMKSRPRSTMPPLG
jgi:hypothetical protein